MQLFKNIIDKENFSNLALAGLTDESFSVFMKELFEVKDKSILIVTSSLFESNNIYSSLLNYTNKASLFPMDDFLTSEAVAVSPDLRIERLNTLNNLLEEKRIVVTNLMGYLRFLPTKEVYKSSFISLKVDDDISQDNLLESLLNLGYVRETIVTKTGEIGVRGFVFDIFPLGYEHPVRIEFFGDTIESIRLFDEDTQKSIENLKEVVIKPYREFILDKYVEDVPDKQKYLKQYSKKVVSILDYLEDYYLIFKDPNQLKMSASQLFLEISEYRCEKDVNFKDSYMFDFEIPDNSMYYLSVDNIVSDSRVSVLDFSVKAVPKFNENIEVIHKYLKESLDFGYTIIICLKDYQIKSFIKHLTVPYVLTDKDNIILERVNIINYEINHGFVYKNYIYLSSKDLFRLSDVSDKKKYKSSFKYASKIKDIGKLNIGDYVVHDVNGIGVYNGIQTLKLGDIKKDYIVVNYDGGDKLYIPVEKINLISKYSGNDGAVVKVHKLGGSEWKKTKARVRTKIQDVANQLLKIYAEREMKKGFMFSKDNDLQISFENEFIYEPTIDQLRAVSDIKEDMESSKPMDRLLCGDVGYGKTEVALRAIFKAVMDSKQVLYLCPTTILSNQQYKNALERFKNYPIRIGLLNRFTSYKEVKRIIDDLKTGNIDVVFGTHRLLSQDIEPKDLGLLIIDEEQRFGVMHKEKLKKYKANVDVLTLTATPIPRTLQMSMVGIRSLSLIETPPVDRYPVQTYVIEENKQIMKDAIYKEMSRGGQVFILYNRVETIEEKMYQIQELVPEARIIVAHGRLNKEEIEDRMLKFIEHEADILLCTTIIETGIDIPNVNTLIIIDADRFGLSQLYQIRGRVGRSNKIAYAYLMYNGSKVLNDTAVKRLNVIKEFTELGSGFSIATRDLSIRGAGDILGSEQAGFIDSVGIDLYLKMLEDEIAHLKGEKTVEEEEKDEKPLLNVTTHISDNYVDDTDLKIEIHRKINEIDSYEKLIEVKSELEDRFGKISEDIIVYMYEEWFEKLAKKLEIISVKQTKNFVELTFSADSTHKIDGEKLFTDAFSVSNMFRFRMVSNCLVLILDTIRLEKHYIYYLVDVLKTIEFKK